MLFRLTCLSGAYITIDMNAFTSIYIDQWLKLQISLSLGLDSTLSSNVWIETSPIQPGDITTRRRRSAGVYIYATDGLIQSTCHGNIKAPTVKLPSCHGNSIAPTGKLPSIEYSDGPGLDKVNIKCGTDFEVRDKGTVAFVSGNGTISLSLWRK